jgi:hypothetical protein
VARIKHGTLVATVVTTVVLDGDFAYVEIINVDGLGPIYYTIDGATPTVAGDDVDVLPGAVASSGPVAAPGIDKTTTPHTNVRLISSATPKYCVKGL